MAKTVKRISRSEKPFRELPVGARQKVEALNSPPSSDVERRSRCRREFPL